VVSIELHLERLRRPDVVLPRKRDNVVPMPTVLFGTQLDAELNVWLPVSDVGQIEEVGM
jgi:hypothetical protein